jgi:hypothetical protein
VSGFDADANILCSVPAPLCSPTEIPETSCADGIDNDCDGDVDAADSDCAPPACTPTEPTETLCRDGIDNDCDGDVDAADSDCAPQGGPIRFVVMGDTGEGNTGQAEVAGAIATVCQGNGGCDFAILLGDNIYDCGVESVSDSQWQTKFEIPYQNLDFPFYAVPGEHDYGGQLITEACGIGNEFAKGPIQVAYTAESAKWRMPGTFYYFEAGQAGFIMLDTNSILWDDTTNGDPASWYSSAVAAVSNRTWKFVIGHHPYRSNGSHGNAGNYDGVEIGGIEVPNPLPILNGSNVKSFFDSQVCGTADFYLSAHDHNRQWLDEPSALCGAELIVSGAGSKTRSLKVSSTNAVHFTDDTTEGFLWVEVDGNTVTGRFYDKAGTMNFERVVTK